MKLTELIYALYMRILQSPHYDPTDPVIEAAEVHLKSEGRLR